VGLIDNDKFVFGKELKDKIKVLHKLDRDNTVCTNCTNCFIYGKIWNCKIYPRANISISTIGLEKIPEEITITYNGSVICCNNFERVKG